MEQADHLPPLHKGPIDQMLIAPALRHDLAVLPDDAVFASYGGDDSLVGGLDKRQSGSQSSGWGQIGTVRVRRPSRPPPVACAASAIRRTEPSHRARSPRFLSFGRLRR